MSSVVTKGKKFALVLPSTNTSVEREFHHLRPQDCSWHTGRIMINAPALDSADAFGKFRECLNEAMPSALEIVMTCKPDYIVMGMSAETFWGGVEGNAAFEQRLRDRTGLPVTTGASSCRVALETLGVRRISVFSPYQPVADREVGRFFREAGFDVAAITGLRCETATDIAKVGEQRLREVVAEIDGPDVEAIVQVGTNLSFVAQAETLEAELGKPVIAINAATLWHALREHGIDDRVSGSGVLLREH